MSHHAGVPAHYDEITELRRTRNPRLSNDHAMPPDDGVVPDLNLIINFRSFANDRIVQCAAIDCGICAYLHVVADYNAAHLRHL